MTLLEQALAAQRAGFCVMPPKEDGSKAPIGTWEEYQKRTSSEDEVRRWYAGDRGGLGVICGETSGFFEVMEFEGRAVTEGLWQTYKTAAEQDERLWMLLQRVMRGYGVKSPSGGIHLGWRCWEGIEKNRKLARRPATPPELEADSTEKVKVLIETRGEGGFIITPPSNGRVHPSGGAYSWLAGGFETIAEIDAEERAELLTLAASFDQMPRQEWQAPVREGEQDAEGERPGDDFNARGEWAKDILEPAGWSKTSGQAGREYWYRKRDGQKTWKSASITADRRYLYVFSTSTELPTEGGLSKFRAYAFLHHGGDFGGAASQLRRDGYGKSVEVIRAEDLPQTPVTPAPASEVVATPRRPRGRSKNWPEALGSDAYHGLPGRMTDLIKPYVESDSPSTLVQFLAAFGIAVGLHPHFMVGATRHAPTTYIGLVGRTSRARKGTSWDPVEVLFRYADAQFSARIMSGIGSGERLVWLVRDRVLDKKGMVQDEGALDRRLLLQEPELARLLTIVNREGSTMSAYLRQAYDGKPLRNEVKTNGSVASLHHIGLIGHCTSEELRNQLKEQQVRNGLANRIAWFLARRAQTLEDPPLFEGRGVDEAQMELSRVLEGARSVMRVTRSEAAQKLWKEWYRGLPDDVPGIVGAISDRAEAQVIRFSLIYALTDASRTIELGHLRAAIALWEFSARCVAHIFGGGTGDVVADRILQELGRGPLTRSEIHNDVFCKNLGGLQLEVAARLLEDRGLLLREPVSVAGRGRPAEKWSLIATEEIK